MNISVILCTYNRCESLKKTLDSLAELVVPQSIKWELLIVDNNSKDRTREVTNQSSESHAGRLRYIFEPRQGLSNARNTGIREARGEVLAFVDDDVTVETNWLYDLTANLFDGQWAGAGGRILPPAGFSPPPWLELRGPWGQGGALCAQFDLGNTAGELKEEAPYGTNMAFRKEIFKKYGGFREDMGRRGEALIGNEDTEFGRRLMSAGERLRYEPSAIVYHSIAKERLNKKYFRSYWFAFGRAQMREKGVRAKVCGLPRHYFSLPNIVFRILLPEVIKWLLTHDPKERFSRECRAFCTGGTLAEIWSQAISGRPAL